MKPEYCPVCGRKHPSYDHCDPRRLARIDAADRGTDFDSSPVREGEYPYGTRLEDGFRMMEGGAPWRRSSRSARSA